MQQEETTYN